MEQLLKESSLILLEGAIVERLRRADGVALHPTLANAPSIYEASGRDALRELYSEYIGIAAEAEVPFLMCTPTWRANRERVEASGVNPAINRDAVRFMQTLRGERSMIRIGGMIGCKNDCYQPEEGLSAGEAEAFHAWQIRELAGAGVDFLLAETLPSVEEAEGIARAMASTGVPFILSFVISRDGRVLDGTSLPDAIRRIDDATHSAPLGYWANCAYPAFLCAEQQPAELFERMIGYQANASSLDHCDLDGADQLHAETVEEWAAEMRMLHAQFGLKILGGCCGTHAGHLRALVCE